MLRAGGNTLTKAERLSGKKDIDALLAGGRWGACGILKYCFRDNGLEYSRIIVSVPKRLFKRAVKRNLLKRRMREAFRVGKPSRHVDILFQYNSTEVADYQSVCAAMEAVLKKISA